MIPARLMMRCLVGGFTWSLALDGECPNHGLRRTGPLTTEDGPTDIDGVPYLGCCSEPV